MFDIFSFNGPESAVLRRSWGYFFYARRRLWARRRQDMQWGAPGLRSSRRLVKFCNLLKISVRMSTNSGLSKLCCEFSRGAVAAVAATNCFSMGSKNLSEVLRARLQDLEPLSDFVASGWVLKEKLFRIKPLSDFVASG